VKLKLPLPVPSILTHKSDPAVSFCCDLCVFSQWTYNTVTTREICLFFFPQVCFSASQQLWISFHFKFLNRSQINRPTICTKPTPHVFKDHTHCMYIPQAWLLHTPNDTFLYSEKAILQNTVPTTEVQRTAHGYIQFLGLFWSKKNSNAITN
jgi:hypothetical protein